MKDDLKNNEDETNNNKELNNAVEKNSDENKPHPILIIVVIILFVFLIADQIIKANQSNDMFGGFGDMNALFIGFIGIVLLCILFSSNKKK